MGAPTCEVVCVLDAHSLVDSESYQRDYRTRSPLEPGHYLVAWPRGSDDGPRYDESAEYIGPFESRRLAELAGRNWGYAPRPRRAPSPAAAAGRSS
ncbi:MAG: hypothetical protein M5U08_24440 [Burkholderiales bacterium]|nr:hypothetical protein [Burkholderiales bacterium]